MPKYSYAKEFFPPILRTGNFQFRPGLLKASQSLIRTVIYNARWYKPPRGVTGYQDAVTSRQGRQIPIEIYSPADIDERAPCLIYIHGGAFFFPLTNQMRSNGCYYAAQVRARLIMPDYRLTPDAPFPAALEDCYDTILWADQNAERLGIDKDRLILIGDSAGGCLAAAVALMARDMDGPKIHMQMLIYPALDRHMQSASMAELADTPWSANATRQMWDLYLANGDHGMPGYASPLQAEDLRNLPPAYIEAAEIDCLRDEAVQFVEALRSAGNLAVLEVVSGAYHGFDVGRRTPGLLSVLDRRCEMMREFLLKAVDPKAAATDFPVKNVVPQENSGTRRCG